MECKIMLNADFMWIITKIEAISWMQFEMVCAMDIHTHLKCRFCLSILFIVQMAMTKIYVYIVIFAMHLNGMQSGIVECTSTFAMWI